MFHLLVPPRSYKSYFLQLFATPSILRPHTQAADEATASVNSCHFTSASAVHSGIVGENKNLNVNVRA